MMKQEQIVEKAKESYQHYFKNPEEITDGEYRGHDVVLDQKDWSKTMDVRKEKQIKKHESLNVLRHQLQIQAEDSFEKTFGEDQKNE